MDNFTIELTPQMLALIPVIGALLQWLKKIPIIMKYSEYLPAASMALSFAILYLVLNIHEPIPVIPAIVLGLTACGGFDLVKQKKAE